MKGCIQNSSYLNTSPWTLGAKCDALWSKQHPSHISKFINKVLKDLIATGLVLVYLNNILIATPHDLTLHQKIVNQVLEKMAEYDLYFKPEKCVFKQRTIIYLGVKAPAGLSALMRA